MGRSVTLENGYYASRPHDSAPWLIRNGEHRVVGHYTLEKGVSWGDYMEVADREWLAALLRERLGASLAAPADAKLDP